MVGGLVGWLVGGCLVAWLVGWGVGAWLVGWLVGAWLLGCLVGLVVGQPTAPGTEDAERKPRATHSRTLGALVRVRARAEALLSRIGKFRLGIVGFSGGTRESVLLVFGPKNVVA